jgi:hypothetical protein
MACREIKPSVDSPRVAEIRICLKMNKYKCLHQWRVFVNMVMNLQVL